MMFEQRTIDIGFTTMMSQASETSKDFMSTAWSDTANMLNITEAEAMDKHKDIIMQIAHGASIDFAAGVQALIIQNAANTLHEALSSIAQELDSAASVNRAALDDLAETHGRAMEWVESAIKGSENND
tara:strand:+ start:370 stop:753 length:384 start_codon:yes stop_codon:yes gene_type:complete